jgi:hypothetical protein
MDAFSRLTETLNTIPASDKNRRMQEIDGFLKEYGNSIVAARARKLAREMEDPKLPAVKPPAHSPVAPAHTAVAPAHPTPPAPAANKDPATGDRDLFNGKDLSGITFTNGRPDFVKVEDGCLYCDAKFSGLINFAIAPRNYTVEVELMLEKGDKSQGAVLNIWTAGGRCFIPRSENEDWITLRATVADGNLTVHSVKGDHKFNVTHDKSKEGFLSMFMRGGCWKKIRTIRLVDEP